MVIQLGRLLPAASSNLPENIKTGRLPGSRSSLRSLIWSCTGWGLQCHPGHPGCGELLPRHFTLTRPKAGGIFSVALSLGSPPVAVSDHPALRCSDFPPDCLKQPATILSAPASFNCCLFRQVCQAAPQPQIFNSSGYPQGFFKFCFADDLSLV